jgi:LysM repeat protein
MRTRNVIAAILTAVLLIGGTPHLKAGALTESTYTVVSGDSLWSISQKYSTTVTNLKSLNNLTSDTIYVGQVLKLTADTASPVPTTQSDSNYAVYTVVSGDSLWAISRKYNTTVDNLVKINNLITTSIYVGQILKVPAASTQNGTTSVIQNEVETVNYKVVPGDTLWGIAQKYKTSISAIKESNMLVSDYLMPNQIITVPVNSTSVVKPVGINMYLSRTSSSFGDVYTWENAMRLWTVSTKGVVKDLATGRTFNVVYYGGSNHSDIYPATQADTDTMKAIFGTWSWSNIRPVVLNFTKGGVKYQMAASLTGMPHSSTDNYTNGFPGHADMYFYNSTGHSSNEISPTHQANVLKASGR